MSTFISLTSILIFINAGIILNHKCGAAQLKLNPKSHNFTSKIKRNLIGSKVKSKAYTPIKIGYDFSTLIKPNTMSESSFTNIKSILKETREEFSKILQVVHKDFNISHLKNEIMEKCKLNTIGKDYSNFLIKNDLIIFPMFKDLGSETLASAGPCLIGDKTFRPHGGILYINTNIKFDITNSKLYVKNILFHEITHILIFHPFFFENLGLTKTEGSTTYITSPKVLEQAKKHFNCSSIKGIPLENQGEKGSIGVHWESRYMLGDYMVSTDYPDITISDITLALFEDSGFYKVNYYSGSLFKFGKNKSCEFFNKKCIENGKATFEEFCDNKGKPKCSSSRTLKSSCYINNYPKDIENKEFQYFSNPKQGGFWSVDYCPVPYELHPLNNYFPNHCQIGTSTLSKEYGETIGDNSFCFMSSLLPEKSSKEISQIPICYEIECDSKNKSIYVKIGSEKIKCSSEGGIINNPSGFKGSIECPKYSEMCSINHDIVCNDMYSCFNAFAKKDNFDYKVSYYDYEEKEEEKEMIDEYIKPIKINESSLLFTNLSILVFCMFILIN